MPLGQFDERNIVQATADLDDSATPGAYVALVAAQNVDYRIDTLQVYNSDIIAHQVRFNVNGSSNDQSNAVVVTVPAGSGYGSPPVDALAIGMPSAYHYVMAWFGPVVQWTVDEAINTGKKVHVFLQGGSF